MYDSKHPKIITKVHTVNNKTVVLSFDDGPSKVLTNILDILKKEDVPAMFFWQTRLLYPKRPWQRVIDEGHGIGTHTINHPNLANMTYDQQYKQIKTSTSDLERITGEKIRYFRPPFGQYNTDTIRVADELGLQTVMWRIASIDWELKYDPDQIISNVIDHVENGAIILLHELEQTVEVLPIIISRLKEKGFTFRLLD
ncbi:polysaccharide deacetylase family protein [Paraliobacillus sediminis]|uniref:polysaccharide deacetylase family protein n=1 Tax=Paraliobacillus sediminis TaxID=1885916 RepID=UPI000E3E8944|nr:polysaccharide deacetylase family protein [Paraliobacillus sediminis]